MGLTNFPNGLSSFGTPVLPLNGFATQGNVYYVKPSTGSDGNTGKSPAKAFKTLAKALSSATANQNDIVFLIGESNTAANTTDYQSATLTWNKDLVHLIGVCSPTTISNRARVALLSTYDTASNLFTLSANGCIISNISFFAGVAGTNPTGCFKLTGQRNYIQGCHIAGIGHANNDIAGAYSLNISAGAENLIENCTIGVDTITRGAAANAEIKVDTAATRNEFRNCKILGLTNHATNWKFLDASASGCIDRYLSFSDCIFLNATGSTGTALTQAFDVHASMGGNIILDRTSVVGATDIADADTGLVYSTMGAAAVSTGSLAVAVTRT